MNEHGYIRSVHRHLPSTLTRWKINDNFASGVPDAWYLDEGADLWVEYKYKKQLPSRASTVLLPTLSEIQKVWLRNAYLKNAHVIVIVGTPAGGVVFSNLSWETGIVMAEINGYLATAKEIAAMVIAHCCGNASVYEHDKTYDNTTGRAER